MAGSRSIRPWSASVAAAQTTRVFHLIQNETADQMFQIATLIRSTGGIQQIWADDLQRTVSVTGTSAELDMTAWYVKQLDRATPPPSPQDYPVGNDDTVRMFSSRMYQHRSSFRRS